MSRSDWLEEMFGVKKPIIAMLHLSAMPGDPHYDSVAGVKAVTDRAREELRGLQDGGIDGVMVSNEFSLPYLTQTEPITAITMARIMGELMEDFRIPYGVNVLWDAEASIDLAIATDAKWVREVFTGVYASDFGLWNTSVGELSRHAHRIGGENVKLLFNIVPESATYLANRDLASVARSTKFVADPDAILVSGLTAGAATDTQALVVVKENVGDTPVFVNTGVRPSNIAEQLSIADGAIMGTYFKEDGKFENKVVKERVEEVVTEVEKVRKQIN